MLKIKTIRKLIIFFVVEVLVFGCSSTPILSTPKILSTQVVNEQYYYCESCNKPAELIYQEYQPLEPDPTPIPTIKPVVVPTTIKTRQHVAKIKHKTHKKHAHKSIKLHKPKQCIQWR